MKYIIFFLSLIFFSCNGQQLNKQTIDEKSGKQMLVGYCDRTAFKDTSFAGWFYTQYENTEVDLDALEQLTTINKENIFIKIVGGSWCSDTRTHLPSLMFILDQIKFPAEKYELLMVDRSKKTEDANVDELDIQFVPTIIVYRDKKEIGRIVETPQASLEKDLLAILQSN